jgi:small conductance mechanosensitive channel
MISKLVLSFAMQTSSASPGEFDVRVVWRTIRGLGESLIGRAPYIVIGIIVFLAFLLLARIIKRTIMAAGERTRLDSNLADLLGRLSSLIIMVLGIFVAAVVIFPTFKPGDLITGLGITSVAIGFASKTFCKTSSLASSFFGGSLS